MSETVKLEIEISQSEYEFVSDAAYVLNTSPSIIISSLVTNSVIKATAESQEENNTEHRILNNIEKGDKE